MEIGWYMIPSPPLSVQKAKAVLEMYPVTEWDDWTR